MVFALPCCTDNIDSYHGSFLSFQLKRLHWLVLRGLDAGFIAAAGLIKHHQTPLALERTNNFYQASTAARFRFVGMTGLFPQGDWGQQTNELDAGTLDSLFLFSCRKVDQWLILRSMSISYFHLWSLWIMRNSVWTFSCFRRETLPWPSLNVAWVCWNGTLWKSGVSAAGWNGRCFLNWKSPYCEVHTLDSFTAFFPRSFTLGPLVVWTASLRLSIPNMAGRNKERTL